jgi:8-amino-3,8-dideoxy-alpha-D-manno-octulosonate transaminase
MPAILHSSRTNKAKLVKRLQSQSKIELSPVFGTERDLGVSLVFYVQDEPTARKVAHALTFEGVQAFQVYDHQVNDQHVYVNWEFLMEKRDPWGGNYPWSLRDDSPNYSKDSCPASLGLLSRAVQIHLNHMVTDEDLDDIVTAINKVAAHLL